MYYVIVPGGYDMRLNEFIEIGKWIKSELKQSRFNYIIYFILKNGFYNNMKYPKKKKFL